MEQGEKEHPGTFECAGWSFRRRRLPSLKVQRTLLVLFGEEDALAGSVRASFRCT